MIDKNFYSLREPIALADLASDIGIELPIKGTGDEMIEVPAALMTSLPGSITFFSNKRLKSQLETAQATACLTTKALEPAVTKTGMIALVTENPRAAFARLSHEMVSLDQASLDSSDIHKTAEVHPTAIIGENVTIRAATKIGAHCIIEDSVTIGKNCIIEPFVRLSFTVMGDECNIKSSSVIGGTGTRITVPAVLGLSPKSELMMAFSTACTMDCSQGVTVSIRASSVLILATWLNGDSAP